MPMMTKIKKQYYLTWVNLCADYFFGVLTFKNNFQSIFMINKKFCRNLYMYKYTCICIYDIHVYSPIYLDIVRTDIN